MWTVVFGDEFDREFKLLTEAVQDELLASAQLLRAFGPKLARPYADTLKGSAFLALRGRWRRLASCFRL